MMTRFDPTYLSRSLVGFDHLARMFDASMAAGTASDAFPPYNIEKRGDDDYRITMAVAGFGHDELNIQVQDGTLEVRGEKHAEESDDKVYLHRGIAARRFHRVFHLTDFVKVLGASLEHGMLHIDLVRELPERMKPRQIKISDGQGASDKRRAISDESAKKAA